MVLCGDLNSHPLSGAVHLLLEGKIGPDHFEAWRHLDHYSWDCGGESFLLEHGYIGNDKDDDSDPAYVDESFEDASEDLFEDPVQTESPNQPNSLLNLHFPPTFPKLISGYAQMPEFTNLSVDFAETLDYILVSEEGSSVESESERTSSLSLKPVRAAPIPTVQEVQEEYGAMPNEFMPSDHVSLVCDLEWTINTKS